MPDFEGPWSNLQPPPTPTPPPHWSQDRRIRLVIVLGVVLVLGLGVFGLMQLFPGRISSGNDWSRIAIQLGFVALVATSLFSRRLKLGDVARYVAIWAAVLALLGLGYVYRGELGDAALRLRSELIPGYAVPTGAHELVLSQDAGGGYSVLGQVNGQPVIFAVDTGASDIVLSPGDAKRLGVDESRLDFARHFETANGVGDGAAYTAGSLAVGPIKFANVEMSINRAPMSTSLLGMAFLKRLKSYEVKDGRLYLRWNG